MHDEASPPPPWFFHIARAEGLSFLILLGIAMPLKYALDMPLAVKWVGWAHGLLFIAYLVALAGVGRRAGWGMRAWLAGGVASVVPLGTFWFEYWLRKGGR